MKIYIKMLMMTVLFLFLFGSMASAHVTVNPATSQAGAWETYTVKVPVEEKIATTKFTLKMPPGVQFMSYQPVSGWNFSTEKDQKGNVKSITFESAGEGILPGQFQQFIFVAKNPDKAENAAWDAFQYYKDGSIVEWTGEEKEKAPHSITKIVKAVSASTEVISKTTDLHPTPKKINRVNNQPYNSLFFTISIISIVLSLFAVILSMRKRTLKQ